MSTINNSASAALQALVDLANGWPQAELHTPPLPADFSGPQLPPLGRVIVALAIDIASAGVLDCHLAQSIEALYGVKLLSLHVDPRQSRKAEAIKAIEEGLVSFAECVRIMGVDSDKDPAARAARRDHADSSDGNIEIDDHCMLSEADGGTWVSAWLWVPEDEIDAFEEDNQEDSAKEAEGASTSTQGSWVIYHSGQPNGERFWCTETGWTDYAGATRFDAMPLARYPLGGSENTQAGVLCIGTMREYTVTMAASPMATACVFECFAEDENHAVEQAENAYPDDQVQSVCLTEDLES